MLSLFRVRERLTTLSGAGVMLLIVGSLSACVTPFDGTNRDDLPQSGPRATGDPGSDGAEDDGGTEYRAEVSVGGVAPADDASAKGLVEEQLQPWDRSEVIDDRHVRVFFVAGDARCYGSRAVMEEDADEVRIAVVIGARPEEPGPCPMVGRPASLLLTTSEPVGTRQIASFEVDLGP